MSKAPRRKLSIIITAGPTREYIDPVRFISNQSSATIGYNLASYAQRRGHKVVLISGPANIKRPKADMFLPVTAAIDMRNAVLKNLRRSDALIMSAAVCDFRPKAALTHKMKKEKIRNIFSMQFVKNPDILKDVKHLKTRQKVIGFALETERLEENARAKLKDKGLDFIVANKLGKKSNPFGNNKIGAVIIEKTGKVFRYKKISKAALSKIIIEKLEGICQSCSQTEGLTFSADYVKF